MATPKAQLLPLTGMRFFLAIWVVIFHQPFLQGFSWMSSFPSPMPSLFHTGYLAVGVFFALSGFVLSYNYPLKEPWSPQQIKRFAIARFARIYPSYCIALLLSAPWVFVSLAQHFSAVNTLKEAAKAAMAWTLIQAWLPQTAETWNEPAWSLSCEAFFYCCFPLLGVAIWRLSRPRSIVTAGLLIWAVSLLAPFIAASAHLVADGNIPAAQWTRGSTGLWVNFVKFNPLLQLPQFITGIVVGRVYHLLRSRNTRLLGRGYWLYIPGILLEILAIVRYQPTLYPLLHNGLLLPLHSLVILGFALGGGPLSRFLSTSPLVLLGNASYSMYIFHGVIGDWMSVAAKRFFGERIFGLDVTVLYTAFVIAFSAIVFKAIEEPANRMLKNRLHPWLERDRRMSPTIPAAVGC